MSFYLQIWSVKDEAIECAADLLNRYYDDEVTSEEDKNIAKSVLNTDKWDSDAFNNGNVLEIEFNEVSYEEAHATTVKILKFLETKLVDYTYDDSDDWREYYGGNPDDDEEHSRSYSLDNPGKLGGNSCYVKEDADTYECIYDEYYCCEGEVYSSETKKQKSSNDYYDSGIMDNLADNVWKYCNMSDEDAEKKISGLKKIE